MDCEGVGPALVDQLVGRGLVKDAADLYSLKQHDLTHLEGIAEKSSRNIMNALASSTDRDFARVIYGLGIRHVGYTTAQLLAESMGNMDRLQSASMEELSKTEGIGPVVASSIRAFFDDPKNRRLLEKLRKAGVRMESQKKPVVGPLSGKMFVFTGELESMSRPDAQAIVESKGGRSIDSVTKAVDYVVAGKDPGSKYGKAKSMGKTILTEKQFLELVKK